MQTCKAFEEKLYKWKVDLKTTFISEAELYSSASLLEKLHRRKIRNLSAQNECLELVNSDFI
jgi:hypothetical protein